MQFDAFIELPVPPQGQTPAYEKSMGMGYHSPNSHLILERVHLIWEAAHFEENV
jgi:hypothetical protein